MKKKRTFFLSTILVLVLGAFGGATLVIHRLYCNQLNILKEYQRKTIPGIICIGDSLTHGGDTVSYPLFLSKDMEKDSIYVNVANMGVGGENTVTIAARMGAIPFRMEEFVIPDDTSAVEVHFISEEQKQIQPLKQGAEGINPCRISGVEGELFSEIHEDGTISYYFKRNENGQELTVEQGTVVETFAQKAYQDGIFVVFMGENHGYTDIDDLIAQYEAVLALQRKNNGKYIVIGLTSGTKEERIELEKRMVETFGEHYINLRDIMSTVGPQLAGVDITDVDREQMEQGIVPGCLRVDGVHYNEAGYQLLADLVYERLQQLGYFDEIKSVTEQYSSLWKSICW